MSQWEQWFRGFMKNWLTALADSMSRLDESTRAQFKSAFKKFQSSEIEGFSEAWMNLDDPGSVKTSVLEVLDGIEEPSPEQMGELKEWLSILMATIEKQEPETRARILSVCGEACAGHATDGFKKNWAESEGLKDFLQKMNANVFQGQELLRCVDEKTIEVSYPKCLCPIVGFGLIDTPTLCNCSSSWLRTNFEAAFGESAEVEKVDTVLAGSSCCSFKVTMK